MDSGPTDGGGPDGFPLAPSQEPFFIFHQMDPAIPAYCHMATTLNGPLDSDLFLRAIDLAQRCHPMLRARFGFAEDHRPRQWIGDSGTICAVEFEDWSAIDGASRRVMLDRTAANQCNHVFDLSCGPLVLITLCRLAPEEHVLLLTLHHIVADGWSTAILLEDILRTYSGLAIGEREPIAPPRATFCQYVALQDESAKTDPRYQAAMEFWRKRLSEPISLPRLPLRCEPRIPVRGPFSVVEAELEAASWQQLSDRAKRSGATPFQFLLAALYLCLHRWTGDRALAVMIATSGRDLRIPDRRRIIGSFADTLPAIVTVDDGDSFSDLLAQTRLTARETLANRRVTSRDLAAFAQTTWSGQGPKIITPIFFSYGNFMFDPDRLGLPFVSRSSGHTGSPFGMLDVFAVEIGDGLAVSFVYPEDVFDRQAVAPMLQSYLSWLKRLAAGADPAAVTEISRSPAPVAGFPYASGNTGGQPIRTALSPDAHESVLGLSHKFGIEPAAVWAAAWLLCQGRISGTNDVMVWVGRQEEQFSPGAVPTTVPIRIDLTLVPTSEKLIRAVNEQLAAADDNAFDLLSDRVRIERGDADTFSSALYCRPQGTGPVPPGKVHDIELVIEPGGVVAAARPGLCDDAALTRIGGYTARLATALAAAPARDTDELEMMDERELRRLLVEFNATEQAFDRTKCLHNLVEEQAQASPGAIAAVFGDRQMTYAELERDANRLAHHLRTFGIGPDQPVGVLVERSLELVTGLLGILKAGGAYLPLDTKLPWARIEQLLRDAGVTVILTGGGNAPAGGGFRCIDLDRDWPEISRHPASRPDSGSGPDNLVSIFYTSGSTGQPKGVANTHLGWTNRMLWMQRAHCLRPGETVLQKTTLTFDDSAVEFFWPLSVGGTIALIEPGAHRDPRAIIDAAIRHQAACVHFVPSMLTEVVNVLTEADRQQLACLRHVVSSGEALRPDLADRVLELLDCELHNQWGATEVSIDSTLHTCQRGRTYEGSAVPVGRPIDNNRVYILDDRRRPVPLGTAGELYLAGVGLARGYFRDPARTRESFVPDPFVPGELMYRTGDRGRYLEDGTIEFLGRTDHQVKVRGNRVELGEIETVLSGHPLIADCAVVAVQTGGETRLVAYCQASATQAPPAELLRTFMADRLPDYMVPNRFILLPSLPRTASGKLDRRSLPQPGAERPDLIASYVPPSTPLEIKIASAWQDVLGLDRVGANDSFFDLGGHSLDATRVMSRINKELGIRLPIKMLFEAETVAALAAHAAAAGQDSPTAAIERLPSTGAFELSHAQRRFWFQYRFDPAHAFGYLYLARIVGPLDAQRFVQSLGMLVERHNALRTTYSEQDGEVRQIVHSGLAIQCEYHDLSHLDTAAQESELLCQAGKRARTPFDLETELSYRFALFRLASDRHALALGFHPIAGDGWCAEVLFHDLAAGYRGEHQSAPPAQYGDYAVWQARRLDAGEFEHEREYWLRRLDGEITPVSPPVDHPVPIDSPPPAVRCQTRVDPAVTGRLRELAAQSGATLYMTLLTGLKMWLAVSSNRTDITVCTPFSGRNHPDLEGILGVLVNPVVMRTDLSGNPSFAQILTRVKETTLEAAANQDYPFDLVVADRRSAGWTGPLYSVVFVVQNASRNVIRLDEGITLSCLPTDQDIVAGSGLSGTGRDPTVQIDFHVEVYELDDCLDILVKYDPGRYRADSVRRFLDQYIELLTTVTADPGIRLSQISPDGGADLDDLF